MNSLIRMMIVAVLVIGAAAAVAFGEDDTPCVPCMQGSAAGNSQKINTPDKIDPKLEATTQEAQEWQCIVVDIIVECVEYETDPCGYCYYPCIGACGTLCTVATVKYCAAVAAAGSPMPRVLLLGSSLHLRLRFHL